MGNERPRIPPEVETAVLTKSARRCCLCYGLKGDSAIKKGQIAHLDRDKTNNNPDNLAFLCFDHHDGYDSKTSQSKNVTIKEAKHYRKKLYAKVSRGQHLQSAVKQAGGLEIVDLDFLESRNERLKVENHSCYSIMKDFHEYFAGFQAWANDPKPKAGELPVLDVKLRNTCSEVAFLKKAVFHVRTIWPMAAFTFCLSEVTVSANYDVLFPTRQPAYTVEKKLSQSIPPNGVDRFTLTLRPDAPAHILLATLELVYDGDSKSIEAGDILFAVRGHDNDFRTATEEKLAQEQNQKLKEQYELNNKATIDLGKINAVRSNVVRAFEAGEL
jgi:hypothetical protein